MPMDRTGLLIIRTWIEEGAAEPLRAEVRIVNDVSTGSERTLTMARAEEVVATVQRWLSDFLNAHQPPV
jgi:phosphosulfolactate phosphohydrolase-like enzyme